MNNKPKVVLIVRLNFDLDLHVVRECGGILTGTSGYISYHLTDYYSSFERCVWTLQVPFATSYYFAVTDYLIADEADGLVISTLYGPRPYSGDYVNDKNISNYHV